MNTVLQFVYFLPISVLSFYCKLISSVINTAAASLLFLQARILSSITTVKIRNSIQGRSRPPPSIPPPPRPRKLPLHTCALSLLATIDRFYVKSQEFDGPVPLTLRNLADLQTGPNARGIKHRFLSLLTKADDRILACEYTIEDSFPFLQQVFDKIDGLVRCGEALPEKVDKLFVLVNKVPILKLLFSCAFSWLEFWVAVVLAVREWKNVKEGQLAEKDIAVDAIADESDCADEFEHNEVERVIYMEVVPEKSKEDEQEDDNGVESDSDRENDPIIDLFESAWLMNTKRKDRQVNTMTRAASFG